jgi:hypothetical protein
MTMYKNNSALVHTAYDHDDARTDLREFGYNPYDTAYVFMSYRSFTAFDDTVPFILQPQAE